MRPHGGPVHVKLRPVDFAIEIQVLPEFSEDTLQRALLGPAAKPVIDGLPVAVATRKIAPGRSGSQNPKDAVDHRPVIFIRSSSACDLGKMRLNAFKLLVAEFESTSAHRAWWKSWRQSVRRPQSTARPIVFCQTQPKLFSTYVSDSMTTYATLDELANYVKSKMDCTQKEMARARARARRVEGG